LGTASYDHTARVWDVKTGQPLSDPFVHGDIVFAANFSPDGQFLATSSDDATARVWDVPTVPAIVPSWFTDFIEALAGRTMEEGEKGRGIPVGQLFAFKERITNMDDADFYVQWARWFFADQSIRAISPSAHRDRAAQGTN